MDEITIHGNSWEVRRTRHREIEQSCYSNHIRIRIHIGIRIPVTQTAPEPTLLSWGGWPREKKIPPPLATLPNPVLSRLSGHSDPIVLEHFGVALWYSVCVCVRALVTSVI